MMNNECNEEFNPLLLPVEKKELKKLDDKGIMSQAALNARNKQIVDGKVRAASALQPLSAVELT